MRLVGLVFLFIIAIHSLHGQQNLVPNPNFGETKDNVDCSSITWLAPILDNVLNNWTSRRMSANFYQLKCKEKQYINANDPFVDSNFIFHQNHFRFSIPAYCCPRAYSQVQLWEVLVPGKNYYLEYYVSPTTLISHLGVLFSDTLIYDAVRNPPWQDPIITEPQLEMDTLMGVEGKWAPWTRIHHCFNVDQPYDVMTIGVFRSNDYLIEQFPVLDSIGSSMRTGYDAFYLIEVEDQLELKIEEVRDTICAGECITLSTNHSRLPAQFEWQLPGSNLGSSEDSTVVVCYPEAGEYDVGIWVEHCFGEYEELWERAVVVLDKPVVESEEVVHHQIAEGDTLRLSLCQEGEHSWPVRWETDAIMDCYDCSEPLFYGLESDSVKAVIAPGSGCSDSCRFFVEVIPRASARFEVDRPSVCVGECVRVENLSRNFEDPIEYHYRGEWHLFPPDAPYLEICPEVPGLQQVTFVVRNALTVDSMTIEFNALALPKRLPVQTHFETDYGEQIELEPGLEAMDYFWSVDIPDHLELDCVDCPNPKVTTYQSSGIELVATNEDCQDKMQYYIHVERKEAQIYLPNVFSPNDDGINDLFGAMGMYFTPLRLKVYDRYGGLLFEGRGQHHEWDGTAQGKKVNPGTYLFTFEYENLYGERDLIKGDVLVLE